MSVLAMILGAGLMVGNGPQGILGEMERDQRLDIPGRWEGVGQATGEIWWAELNNRTLVMRGVFGEAVNSGSKAIGADCWELGEIRESSRGKLIIQRNLLEFWYCGFYKWDGDRLIICFGRPELGGPTSFQPGKQQWLLILHRVKPRK